MSYRATTRYLRLTIAKTVDLYYNESDLVNLIGVVFIFGERTAVKKDPAWFTLVTQTNPKTYLPVVHVNLVYCSLLLLR